MKILYYIVSLFLIINGFLIFISKNPVHSVLFLILCFCNASILLLFFDVEFLGLLFIMIYVGAVAVLFLFVIMMINTKTIKENIISLKLCTIITFLSFISFLTLKDFIDYSFFNYENTNVILNNFDFNFHLLDNMPNIQIIGQILFNYYYIALLISGFVLLIALIGSISLTLHFKKILKNTTTKQLSRNSLNGIHFFK